MSIRDESCSKKMVWEEEVFVGGNWTRYLNACGARAVAQLTTYDAFTPLRTSWTKEQRRSKQLKHPNRPPRIPDFF
jgi:hypothetical protein